MKIYIEDNAFTRPVKGIARFFYNCAADLGDELKEMGRDIKWLAGDKIAELKDAFDRNAKPLKTDQGYDILPPRPQVRRTAEDILTEKRNTMAAEDVVDAEFTDIPAETVEAPTYKP